MMHIAFIEIRSSESINVSKKFADVFHQLPMMLLKSNDLSDDIVIYKKIIERSKKYKLEVYLEELKEDYIRSLS